MKFKLKFSILIVFLFLLSGPLGTISQVSSQAEPDYSFGYISTEQSSVTQVIKGNNSVSDFELAFSETLASNITVAAGGNPDISRSNGYISVSGALDGFYLESLRQSRTFYQQDSYFPDVPVNQRFSDDTTDFNSANQQIQIDENMEEPAMGDLLANSEFTMVVDEEQDLTGFFVKNGILTSFILNDTDGKEIGKIIGFYLSLTIVVYQTSTQQFLVYHTNTITGFGNILPNGLIDRLKENDIVDESDPTAVGREILADSNGPRVLWIDGGYNETLNLDLYYGIFNFERKTETLMIAPTVQTLTLNTIPKSIEEFVFTIDKANSLVMDSNAVDEFEGELVDEVLEEANVVVVIEDDLPNTLIEVNDDLGNTNSPPIINSQVLLIGQIFGLLVLGGILVRRFIR